MTLLIGKCSCQSHFLLIQGDIVRILPHILRETDLKLITNWAEAISGPDRSALIELGKIKLRLTI